MQLKFNTLIEIFLRLTLSAGMLSAVADRFGFWPKEVSAWGNWDSFAKYTQLLLPFLTENAAAYAGGVATVLEILLAVLLLVPFKTRLVARCTGFLLLIFGIFMAVNFGIKAPLDYSVFAASASAFALSSLITKNRSSHYY